MMILTTRVYRDVSLQNLHCLTISFRPLFFLGCVRSSSQLLVTNREEGRGVYILICPPLISPAQGNHVSSRVGPDKFMYQVRLCIVQPLYMNTWDIIIFKQREVVRCYCTYYSRERALREIHQLYCDTRVSRLSLHVYCMFLVLIPKPGNVSVASDSYTQVCTYV